MQLDQSVVVPDDVLVRIVDGEAVLLNLNDESYYGLDDVSTDFWAALTDSATLADAIATLQASFDVDHQRLQTDFSAFVNELVAAGLLTLN